MYYYVYDQFLSEKKYQTLLAKIENRLTDLEIKGKIGRLSLLNNPQELIADAIKRGAKTVVAVGNDNTVSKIINALAWHPDVCLGIIPLGAEQKIARTLGIPESVGACNVLASRIIRKIDLGKIRNQYFLSQVEIASPDVTLECDGKYTITTNKNSSIFIFNFNYWSDMHLADPSDGLLETIVVPKKRGIIKKVMGGNKQYNSLFLNNKIKINHLEHPVVVKIDGQQIVKTPVLVEVASHQLKVIVGKQRSFN